jgi:hypothetical protein
MGGRAGTRRLRGRPTRGELEMPGDDFENARDTLVAVARGVAMAGPSLSALYGLAPSSPSLACGRMHTMHCEPLSRRLTGGSSGKPSSARHRQTHSYGFRCGIGTLRSRLPSLAHSANGSANRCTESLMRITTCGVMSTRWPLCIWHFLQR